MHLGKQLQKTRLVCTGSTCACIYVLVYIQLILSDCRSQLVSWYTSAEGDGNGAQASSGCDGL